MKTRTPIYRVLIPVLLLTLNLSCKKEAIKTAPTVSISAATNITATSASAGGDITADGGATITAKGICWSTNQSPTTSDSKTSNGSGTGSFTGSLTGLTPGATYNIRAYAINSVGTGYSSQSTFTTPALAPVLTTTDLSAITATTATSGGNITNDGGSPVTARGVCWSKNQNPTIADTKTTDGTGTGSFTSAITGLTPGTTYYFRTYATNSIGTAYGNQITITTTATLPVITTTGMSAITATTAISGGNITNAGGSITARGVCWNTSQNPTTANFTTTDGIGSGSFASNLINLSENTTYYLRAYATNSAGTGYGSQVSFKTLVLTVADIDGNVYQTVTIGTQVWMVENLKTTKYNDGSNILNITDNVAWYNLTTPGYCWYNNDAANKYTYGALYNGYTVSTGKLCPVGWHVPSSAEWTTLMTYLGGLSVVGSKINEAGTIHWLSPNTEATNSSGFTALPGGSRGDYADGRGTFSGIGRIAYWWSSTALDATSLWNFNVGRSSYWDVHDGGGLRNLPKQCGFSVRCLKD